MMSAPAANHAYSPLEIRPPDLLQSDSSSWFDMWCEPMTCITCFRADMLPYAVSNANAHDVRAHGTRLPEPAGTSALGKNRKHTLSHTKDTERTSVARCFCNAFRSLRGNFHAFPEYCVHFFIPRPFTVPTQYTTIEQLDNRVGAAGRAWRATATTPLYTLPTATAAGHVVVVLQLFDKYGAVVTAECSQRVDKTTERPQDGSFAFLLPRPAEFFEIKRYRTIFRSRTRERARYNGQKIIIARNCWPGSHINIIKLKCINV